MIIKNSQKRADEKREKSRLACFVRKWGMWFFLLIFPEFLMDAVYDCQFKDGDFE